MERRRAAVSIRITEETFVAERYTDVPIAFEVREVYDVLPIESGLGGFTLSLRTLEAPYVKDYDAISHAHPNRWPTRFDISRWGFLAARRGQHLVGRAAIARGLESDLTTGRKDIAVLWDVRVAPSARRVGVGSALFEAAMRWAKSHGMRELVAETQNVNVGACRFYARHGCVLGSIDRCAYPELTDEAQLLWYRDLNE